MATDEAVIEKMKRELENDLLTMMHDGFLSDVVEVQKKELAVPEAIAPWSCLPFKLYKSATATKVLKTQLDTIVPGTTASYNQIIGAIMEQTHTESFCFLVGGHVRDILRGKVGNDIDFNYACTAQDVAMVCVKNMWPVKFKAIGPVSDPNYVLIGDESTDAYMEGFSLSFNAVSECFRGDFRQNMLFYDCTNHIIVDKSGFGVEDIRNCDLRLACAPSQNFEDWAASDITYGLKALRYVKFMIRSKQEGKMFKTEDAECSFVVSSIKKAFCENAPALNGFWFGYALGGALSSSEGISNLREWVVQQCGLEWWDEWMPFIRPKIGDQSWLNEDPSGGITGGEIKDADCVLNDIASAINNTRPDSRMSAHQLDDIANAINNSRPVSRMTGERRVSKSQLADISDAVCQKVETKERVKNFFRSSDVQGDGFIGYSQLKHVMQALDPSWTDDQFDIVVGKLPINLKYDDFVEYIFTD